MGGTDGRTDGHKDHYILPGGIIRLHGLSLEIGTVIKYMVSSVSEGVGEAVTTSQIFF